MSEREHTGLGSAREQCNGLITAYNILCIIAAGCDHCRKKNVQSIRVQALAHAKRPHLGAAAQQSVGELGRLAEKRHNRVEENATHATNRHWG